MQVKVVLFPIKEAISLRIKWDASWVYRAEDYDGKDFSSADYGNLATTKDGFTLLYAV